MADDKTDEDVVVTDDATVARVLDILDQLMTATGQIGIHPDDMLLGMLHVFLGSRILRGVSPEDILNEVREYAEGKDRAERRSPSHCPSTGEELVTRRTERIAIIAFVIFTGLLGGVALPTVALVMMGQTPPWLKWMERR